MDPRAVLGLRAVRPALLDDVSSAEERHARSGGHVRRVTHVSLSVLPHSQVLTAPIVAPPTSLTTWTAWTAWIAQEVPDPDYDEDEEDEDDEDEDEGEDEDDEDSEETWWVLASATALSHRLISSRPA